MIDIINNFDFMVLDWIQAHLRCAFLDAVMPVVTYLGWKGAFFIACAVLMLFFSKWRKTGWSIGVALLLGLIVCNMIVKPLVARIRPYDLRAVALLIAPETDFSFPSGHTIAAFEFATTFALCKKKWAVPVYILAFVTAFSRLYLYMHYPTDVFVSIILGSLFGVLGVKIVDKIYKMIENKTGKKRAASACTPKKAVEHAGASEAAAKSEAISEEAAGSEDAADSENAAQGE